MRNGRFVVDDSELDEIDNRGWMIKKEVADLSPALAEERLAWDDTEMNAENESDNVFHLDHLLSMLRQRNIEADFVTLPVWHNYKEGMKPGYWSETQRVVAQRTNNYSVYYYSYLSAPQLESQDFIFDINHLNALYGVAELGNESGQTKFGSKDQADIHEYSEVKHGSVGSQPTPGGSFLET